MMLAREMWPQDKNAGDQTIKLLVRAMAIDGNQCIKLANHLMIIYERHAAS